MIILKEMDEDFVTVQMNKGDLSLLNNLIYEATKNIHGQTEKIDLMHLSIHNLYEIAHHGFITDFGRTKNVEYAIKYNEYSHNIADAEE